MLMITLMMEYADLSEANLSKANLTEVNLQYANLAEANLYKADLKCVNLSHANLKFVDLSGIDKSKVTDELRNLFESNANDAVTRSFAKDQIAKINDAFSDELKTAEGKEIIYKLSLSVANMTL